MQRRTRLSANQLLRTRTPPALRVALCTTLAIGFIAAPAAHARRARPAPPPRTAQELVKRWAQDSALRGVTVGVSVVRLRDKEDSPVASLGAHALLYPASVAKVLTAVAALRRLAPGARWATRVLGTVGARGVAQGPLVLRGEGDPKLTPDGVQTLADACWERGVRSAPEGVVVDGLAFAPPAVPPRYDEKPSTAGYRASVGAVSANFGAVRVSVRPGRRVGAPVRVAVSPASSGVQVAVRARTVAGRQRDLRYTLRSAGDGRTELVVRGTMGVGARRVSERRRVLSPDAWTGYLFVGALRRRGVRVTGPVRVAEAPSALPPTLGPVLGEVHSEPLEDALRDLLTWSNNYMAEVIFKHLGRPQGSPHALAPARWGAAQAAVGEVMGALGLPAGEVQIVNGSGLYHATRVSAGALTTLLARVRRDPSLGPRLLRALPVSGRTGTLAHRLGGRLRGRVHAKTGTLDDVVALAGYLDTRGGPTLAFAVLINGATARRTAALRRAVDRLVRALDRRYRRRH